MAKNKIKNSISNYWFLHFALRLLKSMKGEMLRSGITNYIVVQFLLSWKEWKTLNINMTGLEKWGGFPGGEHEIQIVWFMSSRERGATL